MATTQKYAAYVLISWCIYRNSTHLIELIIDLS